MRIHVQTMEKLFQILLVAMCAMTMATAVEAKSSKKNHVMILEVKINSSDSDILASVCGEESLTITGTGFTNKDFPLVFLGNREGDGELGDLFLCAEPSDTVIDVSCPGGMCPPGDFRLEVFTSKGGKSFKKSGKSSKHYDSYDLTIDGDGGGDGDGSLTLSIVDGGKIVDAGAEPPTDFFVNTACNDPDNEIAISGGYDISDPVLVDIISTLNDGGSSWTVTGVYHGAINESIDITTQIVCIVGSLPEF